MVTRQDRRRPLRWIRKGLSASLRSPNSYRIAAFFCVCSEWGWLADGGDPIAAVGMPQRGARWGAVGISREVQKVLVRQN